MSAVHVQGVVFGYGGPPVLEGVDLVVAAGTLTSLIGPSGCGKTTLLRLLAGFERPARGRIVLGDREVAGARFVPADRRRIGIVPQEGALFPHLRVGDNIGFALPRRHPGRAARIAELLDLIGLRGYEERYPRELSGGQQQRVALARALAPRPEVVLLDEPFASLDAGTRHEVRREVRRVLREERATALMVTHDREEALSVADQVVVLDGGRVAQCGPPEVVYRRPASAAVATLLGRASLLPVLGAEGTTVRCALGDAPVGSRADADASDVQQAVLVRPEQVALSSDGGAGGAGEVLDAELLGPVWRVHVRVAEHVVQAAVPVTVAVPPVGARVWASIAGPVHLVPRAIAATAQRPRGR